MADIIKCFKELYVGWQKRGDTYLAFATPWEDNAAGRKRKATVDGWAHSVPEDGNIVIGEGPLQAGNVYDEKFRWTKTFKNEPLEGYKIDEEVRRDSRYGGNVVWRIADPRGFTLEISSGNLMKLLEATSINKGVIEGKCVWARLEGKQILVSEGSDQWKQLVGDSKLFDEKGGIKKTEAEPGDLVRVKRGTTIEEAIYLGKAWAQILEQTAKSERAAYYSSRDQKHVPHKRRVVGPLHAIADSRRRDGWVDLIKTNPVVEVIKKGHITPEEAQARIHGAERYSTMMTTNPQIEFVHTEKFEVAEPVVERIETSRVTALKGKYDRSHGLYIDVDKKADNQYLSGSTATDLMIKVGDREFSHLSIQAVNNGNFNVSGRPLVAIDSTDNYNKYDVIQNLKTNVSIDGMELYCQFVTVAGIRREIPFHCCNLRY